MTTDLKTPRWYRGGEARFMSERAGWIMARKPGCVPFTVSLREWLNLSTAEDGARCAAEFDEASKP